MFSYGFVCEIDSKPGIGADEFPGQLIDTFIAYPFETTLYSYV